MFLPDGRSVAMTVDAAAHSTLLLARAVRRASLRSIDAADGAERSPTTIPVDFRRGSRPA